MYKTIILTFEFSRAVSEDVLFINDYVEEAWWYSIQNCFVLWYYRASTEFNYTFIKREGFMKPYSFF